MLDERRMVAHQMHENIEMIASLQARVKNGLTWHQRTIETIPRLLGRPYALYVLLLSIGGWVGYNSLAFHYRLHVIDEPPFFWLQGLITLYAALTATVVLATQNRQNGEAESRSNLELQVNLLAEQRTAKIISLLEELRRDLPNVPNRSDSIADALQDTVQPEDVFSAIESNTETNHHLIT